MAETTATHVLFKTMAQTTYAYSQANQFGCTIGFSDWYWHEFKRLLSAGENQGCPDGNQQSVAGKARLSINQAKVDHLPLSKWLVNRPVRSRMQGGVGRAGEKPAFTRLCARHGTYVFVNANIYRLSNRVQIPYGRVGEAH